MTDDEIDSYLNIELAELYDLVVTTHDDYSVTTATASISSVADDIAYFAVPADYMKARCVERQRAGRWERIHRLPSLNETDGWLGYIVLGAQVHIRPASQAIGTYRMYYVPSFAVIASGGSLPASIDTNAWHAFAVAGACARVMRKQELDAGPFYADKTTQQMRVLNAAHTRDSGPAASAVDARGALGVAYKYPYPRRRSA